MQVRFCQQGYTRVGNKHYYQGQWADLPDEQAEEAITRGVAQAGDAFPAGGDWPISPRDWAEKWHPETMAEVPINDDEARRFGNGSMSPEEKEALISRMRSANERLRSALLSEIERDTVRLVYRLSRVLATRPDGRAEMVPAPPGDPFRPWKAVPYKDAEDLVKGREGLDGCAGINFSLGDATKIRWRASEIEVRVDLAGPNRAAAARKAGSNKAKNDCKNWLFELAKQGPKEHTKDWYWQEARDRFGPRLSRRGFLWAWSELVKKYPSWGKPGAPKKSKPLI